MEKSWFSKRLTDAKQKSVLYLSLAEIIQSLTSSFVEPFLQRITNRKSIFSMGEEDLAIRTNELGQFFTIRTENSSSIPMLLQQRFDEIHFKGTDRPINQTIYREFDGLHVAWEPLYAPVDIEKYPYGTVLITQSTLESTGGIYGEMFLTSRGMISVSINELTENMGAGTGSERADQSEITEAVLTKFNQFVRPLLPLHIVFDGLSLFISVYADELPETFTLFSVSDTNKAYVWTEIADEVISFDIITRLPTITPPTGDLTPGWDDQTVLFDRTKLDMQLLDRKDS
ncbi:phage tail protein [Citrobacter werkmanii]|uniref:phage tail protein n=1 Tax=Citrobacter werkmanii TaxID=67827 RepID=UPI00346401A5